MTAPLSQRHIERARFCELRAQAWKAGARAHRLAAAPDLPMAYLLVDRHGVRLLCSIKSLAVAIAILEVAR